MIHIVIGCSAWSERVGAPCGRKSGSACEHQSGIGESEICTENTANPADMKPELKIKLVGGGKPEIIWKKQGMDRVEIVVDRGTGTFAF